MVIMKDTAVDKNTLNSLMGIVRLSLSPFISQENVIKSITLFTVVAITILWTCLFIFDSFLNYLLNTLSHLTFKF